MVSIPGWIRPYLLRWFPNCRGAILEEIVILIVVRMPGFNPDTSHTF